MAESWFGTLTVELIHRQYWGTRAQARSAIVDYIEVEPPAPAFVTRLLQPGRPRSSPSLPACSSPIPSRGARQWGVRAAVIPTLQRRRRRPGATTAPFHRVRRPARLCAPATSRGSTGVRPSPTRRWGPIAGGRATRAGSEPRACGKWPRGDFAPCSGSDRGRLRSRERAHPEPDVGECPAGGG